MYFQFKLLERVKEDEIQSAREGLTRLGAGTFSPVEADCRTEVLISETVEMQWKEGERVPACFYFSGSVTPGHQ